MMDTKPYQPLPLKWMVVEGRDASHVPLKPRVRPATVRHLLSHTSGLTGMSELQQVTGASSTPFSTGCRREEGRP
jgi:CubicO group peptidase (beta-lactamase class C family)